MKSSLSVRSLIPAAVYGCLLAVCLNCSKTSSSATATLPTSIADLPQATGIVASSSSISKDMVPGFIFGRNASWLESATTGTLLKNWSTTTWGASASGSMCNTGNMTQELLSEAANSDRMMCYVGAMQAGSLFPASATDGSVHYFALGGTGGGGGLKIKMQVTKNADTSISTFKMWTCENSTTSNDSYNGVDLTDPAAISLVSVGSHSDHGNTGSQRTVVTGTINATGEWLTKVISHNGSFSGGSGSSAFSMGQKFSLTQYANYATLNGFFTGTFGAFTNSGQIYADFAILGADKLPTYAIGNGTLSSKFTWTGGGGGGPASDSSAQIRAWLGDTQAPTTATSSDFYTQVSAATLASVTTPDTSMLTAETWDCAAGADGFTTLDMSSASGDAVMKGGIADCDAKLRFSASGGGGWVNCQSGGF